MSTTDPCNCHDAARWKRRALAAELSLAFTKRQLEGVLAVMPGGVVVEATGAVEAVELVGITEGVEASG